MMSAFWREDYSTFVVSCKMKRKLLIFALAGIMLSQPSFPPKQGRVSEILKSDWPSSSRYPDRAFFRQNRILRNTHARHPPSTTNTFPPHELCPRRPPLPTVGELAPRRGITSSHSVTKPRPRRRRHLSH